MTQRPYKAVVIGASAGAFEALSAILPALPPDYPLPIMVVVHLPSDQKSIIAELFQTKCKVQVKEAEDKEFLQPSTIYFAPPDYHLMVENNQQLSLSSEEPVLHSRPSIDVLFETAADVYGSELIGVVLSGASEDGARGLKAIMDAGGLCFVQNPKHAYATAMPTAALHTCAAAHALNLQQIASQLQEAISP